MNITFEGKVALVTGAAGDIGLATARMFAEAGAAVALVDISKAVMERAEEIASAVLWLCSDLAGFAIGSQVVMDGGYTII